MAVFESVDGCALGLFLERSNTVWILLGLLLELAIVSLCLFLLHLVSCPRVKLALMPVKHHPNVSYVTHVKTTRMVLFTVLQVLLSNSDY